MNFRFVLRGLVLALPLAVLLAAFWIWLQSPWGRPLDPTPPPPAILAAAGDLPPGPVGLREWARYRGGDYGPVGSGFFLQLPAGPVVGVTAAHSVQLGVAGRPLEQIALGVAGQDESPREFNTAWGLPGRHFTGGNLTLDYLFLKVTAAIDPELLLVPDPRGIPQPGERVVLFSGLGDGRGGRRALEGTVQTAGETAVWVVMDEKFDPSQMSGSPLVSRHTGQVVGMAVAASPRRDRLLIGVHPIGSLVRRAQSATEFPRLSAAGSRQP